MKCPKCDGTSFFYVESTDVYYDIVNIKGNSIYIDPLSEDVSEGLKFNMRFLCKTCGHEWPIPEKAVAQND